MQTFTLEEAAALIANKYGWHEGAHTTLVKQLLDAAQDGTLTVRHPHTDLPYRPQEHCEYYERVGVADLNGYFKEVGIPWRLDNDGGTVDPIFETEWWNLHQVLAWVYLGDRALVKQGATVNQGAAFAIRLKLEATNRQGACYASFSAAEKALVEALQTGKLTAYGLRNDDGDLTEIPSLQWADLKFWWDPDHAGPSDCFRPMATRWFTPRFKRKAVLAIWPDPLDQLDHRRSAEEQPAGVPEKPGIHPVRVGENVFKDMDALTWAEITITFTERDAVRIRARARNETFTFDAMGFKNRKSLLAEPNQCWQTLKCLAIVSTCDKTWNDAAPAGNFKSPLKKRISQLRDQLQRFFGLADNPIAYRRGVGYEVAFNLQAEDHVIQAVREGHAASADDSEEDDIQRLMSEKPYR